MDDEVGHDVSGDVDVFSECGEFVLIQLQGLHTKPLAQPSAATDLQLFSEVIWKAETPAGAHLELHGDRFISESKMFDTMERVAYFYMRTLAIAIPPDQRHSLAQHNRRFLEYADYTCHRVAEGGLPHIREEWEHDTQEGIRKAIQRYPDSIDLQLMHAVGQNLPAVFRGEINALEPMVKDDMLNRFYVDAMGMSQYTEDLARMTAHITH